MLPGHDNVSPASWPDPGEGGGSQAEAAREPGPASSSRFTAPGGDEVPEPWPGWASQHGCSGVHICTRSCGDTPEVVVCFRVCVCVCVTLCIHTTQYFPGTWVGVGFHPTGPSLEGSSNPALPTPLPSPPISLLPVGCLHLRGPGSRVSRIKTLDGFASDWPVT